MSHLVETMAYVGEVPWHGLGTQLPQGVTPREMQIAAGLDWRVERKPLVWLDEDGQANGSNHVALVRSDNQRTLDVVPDDWIDFQNDDAAEFFVDFINQGEGTMETAGSLREGRHTWFLARMQAEGEVVKGDLQRSYLLLSNPHQYGKSITCMLTPIRVVCNNTITWALNKASEQLTTKFSHRTGFDAEEAALAVRYADQRFGEYLDQAKFIANIRASRDAVIRFLDQLFPATGEKAERKELSSPGVEVLQVLETQPGAQLAEGTWWQAYNAVTYGVDHLLGRSPETRLNSAWFGVGAGTKRRALELATKMAKAA